MPDSIGKVRGDELHQKAVVPGAVGPALVLAERPDRTKPDLGVAADCGLVVGGGIDGQPVMSSVSGQVLYEGVHGVGSVASPVHRWIEEDVDAGVAVVGVGLLLPLDPPNGCPGLVLDDEKVEFVGRQIVGDLGFYVFAAPASPDLRPRSDPGEGFDVVRTGGAESHRGAREVRHVDMVASPRWRRSDRSLETPSDHAVVADAGKSRTGIRPLAGSGDGEPRDTITATAANRDDGTNDLLMSDVLRRDELQVWFLAEHLVDTPATRA